MRICIVAATALLMLSPAWAQEQEPGGTSLDELWLELDYSRLPAALEEAIAERPEQARLHYQLGVVRFDLRQLPEATAALQRALELDPKLADAWVKLGQVQWFSGQPHGAQESVARALELQPGHPEARHFEQFFRDVAALEKPKQLSSYPSDSPEAFVESVADIIADRPREALESLSDRAIARIMGSKSEIVDLELRRALLDSLADAVPSMGSGMKSYRIVGHDPASGGPVVRIRILAVENQTVDSMSLAAIEDDSLGQAAFDPTMWSVLAPLSVSQRRAYLERNSELHYPDIIEARVVLAGSPGNYKIDDVLTGDPPTTSLTARFGALINEHGAKLSPLADDPPVRSRSRRTYDRVGLAEQIGRGALIGIVVALLVAGYRRLRG